MPVSRKEFMTLLFGFTSTAWISTHAPWLEIITQRDTKLDSEPLRIGFIGVGSRGKTLLLNVLSLNEQHNFEVVGLCDTYEPHLKEAMELTGGSAKGFSDYRVMFDQIKLDAVVIATPLHEHAQMSIDALDLGIHVYLEKAMGRTLTEVKDIYDAHKRNNTVLQIGHQRMFSPVYLEAMSKLNNEDTIGTITMLRGCWMRNTEWLFYNTPGGRNTPLDRIRNWRLYWESSAGMITELGSHHFQVANWILGKQPISVVGNGSLNYFKDGREVHDTLSLIFEYPDGIQFSYDCLNSNRHNGMSFQALGSKATLDLEHNKLYLEDPPEPPAIRSLIHSIEQNLFETIPIGGSTWIPDEPVDYGGSYISPDYQLNDTQLALDAFLGFAKKGEAPEELPLEGYHASIWSLLAEQASREGRRVYLPDEYKL